MPPPPASRSRRGRARKSPALHVSVFNCMPEPLKAWERDWAELPADAISCVLHKLSLTELLLGGVAEVCRSWRRAAREEPELWRYIDVSYLPNIPAEFTSDATRFNFMRSALRFSAGQCRTFLGKDLDDDQFMLLVKWAPTLKSLHLYKCYRNFFNGGFVNGIKKLPLLKELRLVDSYVDEQALEIVAQVCRCLEHLTLEQQNWCCNYRTGPSRLDDSKAFAIARMHGLRSLVLAGDNLGNQGLTAIIDNCPHLEYLDIDECCNVTMDGNLTAKCSRIMVSYREYFPPSKPCSCWSSPMWFDGFSDGGPYYEPDYYHDLSLYSYLGDEIDNADYEEHERILDVKRMRRYLS